MILTTLDNPNFNELIENHELSALISEPTCFKSINTLTFETGVSDHHKLIGTMQRSTFAKGKTHLHLSSVLDFESFHFAFWTTLDRFVPLQLAVRNYNQPFMAITLRKAIMKRFKLNNKFNKERNAKNWPDYKQQRNYC